MEIPRPSESGEEPCLEGPAEAMEAEPRDHVHPQEGNSDPENNNLKAPGQFLKHNPEKEKSGGDLGLANPNGAMFVGEGSVDLQRNQQEKISKDFQECSDNRENLSEAQADLPFRFGPNSPVKFPEKANFIMLQEKENFLGNCLRQNQEETRPLRKERDVVLQESSVKTAEGKSLIRGENKTVPLDTGNPEGCSQLIAGSFRGMSEQDPMETAPSHPSSLPGLLLHRQDIEEKEQQELGGTLPGAIVSPGQLPVCKKRMFEQLDSKLQEVKEQKKEDDGVEQCQVLSPGSQKITPLMDAGLVPVSSDDLPDVQPVPLQPKSHAQPLEKTCKTSDGRGEQVARDPVGHDTDEEEDEKLLQNLFEEETGDYDPRRRFVVRFRYKGLNPHKLTERYMIETIVLGTLQVPKPDVLAIIRLQGLRETDLCLISEGAYQRLWGRVRVALRSGTELLDDYDLIPQFREHEKVVTVAFRTMNVPEKDVGIWLKQHCKLLMPPRKQLNERRARGGQYKAVVALHRDNRSNLKHLPKYFFLGNNRGVTRYSGQPPACYQCGGYDDIRQNCEAPLCEACAKGGHGSRHPERKSGHDSTLESV